MTERNQSRSGDRPGRARSVNRAGSETGAGAGPELRAETGAPLGAGDALRSRTGPDGGRPFSRRSFIQTSAALAAGAAVFPGFAHRAYASGTDTLRVGLIGCGGRGTRGIIQNMECAPGIELISLGDLAPDRLEQSRQTIADYVEENPELRPNFQVTDDRCFSGFDAYKRVLETDVDLVMLATPPGFRPLHLAAAIDAGKHVFAEKPVATDAAGVRSCLETYERARAQGLGIGVGTQRRHHSGYLELIRRIRDGQMGEIVNGQVYWNQGGLWSRQPQDDWTETEWQIRNWLYFTWLSGDHIVEQHVHQHDVANWVLDAVPVRATAVGGRQQRVDPVYGHIYDHFSVDYEYPDGVHIMSMARQIPQAQGRIGEWFQGTRGRSRSHEGGGVGIGIEGPSSFEWERPDDWVSHLVQEHTDLVTSIRAGEPINDLRRIAESTLTAIMGREAAYTGRTVEWDEALNADQDLNPAPLDQLAYGPLEVPPVAIPGRTQLDRRFIEGW